MSYILISELINKPWPIYVVTTFEFKHLQFWTVSFSLNLYYLKMVVDVEQHWLQLLQTVSGQYFMWNKSTSHCNKICYQNVYTDSNVSANLVIKRCGAKSSRFSWESRKLCVRTKNSYFYFCQIKMYIADEALKYCQFCPIRTSLASLPIQTWCNCKFDQYNSFGSHIIFFPVRNDVTIWCQRKVPEAVWSRENKEVSTYIFKIFIIFIHIYWSNSINYLIIHYIHCSPNLQHDIPEKTYTSMYYKHTAIALRPTHANTCTTCMWSK